MQDSSVQFGKNHPGFLFGSWVQGGDVKGPLVGLCTWLPLDVHIHLFACISKGSAGIPAVSFVNDSLDSVLELQQFGHVENVGVPGKQITNLLCVVLSFAQSSSECRDSRADRWWGS